MTLGTPSTPPIPTGRRSAIKPELLRLLDALPRAKQVELLDFARFLQQQAGGPASAPTLGVAQIELRVAPATSLNGLTGLVALGGDAVADTESLYDGNDNGLH